MPLFRSRSRRPLGPTGRIITGLLGMGLVAYAASGSLTQYTRADVLVSRGQTTQASIIDTRTDRTGRRSSSSDYFVTAVIQARGTNNAGAATQEREVTEACYHRYRSARPDRPMSTMVVYDPDDPDNWHPQDDLQDWRSAAQWMLVILGAILLGLLATVIWGVQGVIANRNRVPR